MPPTVRGTGTIASGTTSASPGLPATGQVGDLLVMFVESAHGDTVSASGWNSGPVIPTAANPSVDTQLQVFYKIMAGGDSTLVTSSIGDHVIARIVGITKDTFNAEIFQITQTSTELTADTSGSIQGLTTTFDETLILMGVAVGGDPASDNTTSFSGHSNANLSSLTERADNGRVDGSGGHLAIYSGQKFLAGVTGNTTFTSVPSAYKAMVCFAIRNPSEEGSFPVVAPSAVAVATQISAATTPWTVTLPGSVAANDLLLVFVRVGGAHNINLPGGWTSLVDNMIDDTTDDNTSVFWKLATGGETSVSVTLAAADKGVAFAYRITGTEVSPPILNFSVLPSVTPAANIASNDCNMSTIRNHLWISVAFLDGTSQTFTAPSGFSGLVQGNSGAGGTVASNVRGATCWRQELNYHLTPGNYTNAASNTGHTTLVVGVIPLAPVSTPKSGTDAGSGSDASAISAQIVGTDTGVGRQPEIAIDSFNRPNEGPPPSIYWQNWKQTGMVVNSNQLAPGSSGANDVLWSTGIKTVDVEAYIEIAAQTDVQDLWTAVVARMEPTTVSGYMVQYYVDYLGVAGNDYLNIHRWDNWSATLIGGSYVQHLNVGDAFGIRCVGSNIQAWARVSGAWILIGAVTDATYSDITLNNRVGLIHAGAGTLSTRFDNFGAGSAIPVVVTQNSSSDTGTGSENSVLAIASTVTDIGIGSENSTLDTHAVPVSASDTSIGTDVVILATAISVSDAGFPSLENGSVVIAPILTGDDTGAGTEVISQFTRNLPEFGGDVENFAIATSVSDSGSGLEGILALARPLQDAGTGVDSYAISKFVDDAGAGSDNRVNTALFSGSDSGGGFETLGLAARYTQSDTSAGVDASLSAAQISGSDSGVGIEASVIKAVVSDADSGGLAAETGILALTISVSDNGTASEASVLVTKLTPSDTGTAVETPLFSLLFADSVIGSDATAMNRLLSDFGGITEAYTISVLMPSDTGSTAEIISGFTRAAADFASSVEDASISVGNERIGSESGSFVETALVRFITSVFDSGIGIEISGSNTPVFGGDSGTFIEAFAIRTTLSEVALGEDITSFSRILFDTGIAAEGQSITAGNTRQDSDSGHVSENYVLDKILSTSDSGIGIENPLLNASFATLDSGLVSEIAPIGAAPVRIDDNGQGADAGALRQWKSVSDSGTFTEKGHAGLFVKAKFHESILVTVNGENSTLIGINDPYRVGV